MNLIMTTTQHCIVYNGGCDCDCWCCVHTPVPACIHVDDGEHQEPSTYPELGSLRTADLQLVATKHLDFNLLLAQVLAGVLYSATSASNLCFKATRQ